MLRTKLFLWLVIVLGAGVFAATGQGNATPAALAAFPGPDNLQAANQQCLPSGRVRVVFNWTAYNSGPLWMDLSIFNNGFAPSTFVGVGPQSASDTSFTWD